MTTTTKAQHTPGPWTVTEFAPPAVIEATRDGEVWAVAECGNGELPSVENDANARLIAAAPELLEACRTMMTFEALIREHRPAAVYTLENARAAITKATGN